MFVIFKIFFIDNFSPNNLVDGCYTDNCKAARCIGYNCECKSCQGDNCEAGYCIGENCRAGDCYGVGCRAGDCYGYGCKPGVCHDPTCIVGTCPQTNKKCKDGKAKPIPPNFYLRNGQYFPKNTIMNPQLCNPKITLNDVLIGRTKGLDIEKIYFNKQNMDKVNEVNSKNIEITTTPPIFKNLNCEICRKDGDYVRCNRYDSILGQKGQIQWK
jgi:hypothetical protein